MVLGIDQRPTGAIAIWTHKRRQEIATACRLHTHGATIGNVVV